MRQLGQGILSRVRDRHDKIESGQHRSELDQKIDDPSARRQNLQVDHPREEIAIQHPELPACIGHDHASIKVTICCVMPAMSCSIANCEKIASSVGSDISMRSCSMESFATTRPLCRITMRAETRSTVSSSCELNRTTLPRAASSWIRLRSTNAELTSRPEKGSSSRTISGLCRSAAASRTFCRMPFEYEEMGT